MNFSDVPSGASVFVDANVFVYNFAPNPQYGPACRELMERIEVPRQVDEPRTNH